MQAVQHPRPEAEAFISANSDSILTRRARDASNAALSVSLEPA